MSAAVVEHAVDALAMIHMKQAGVADIEPLLNLAFDVPAPTLGLAAIVLAGDLLVRLADATGRTPLDVLQEVAAQQRSRGDV